MCIGVVAKLPESRSFYLFSVCVLREGEKTGHVILLT